MQRGHSRPRVRPTLAALAALAGAALTGVVLLAAAAWAEDPSSGGSRDVCVDVGIGRETYYACVNEQLRRLAKQSHGLPPQPAITATSPAPAVGTYNQAATRERMGTAFGVSATPQRPPPPVYPNPLVNR